VPAVSAKTLAVTAPTDAAATKRRAAFFLVVIAASTLAVRLARDTTPEDR
jgi:hypothetical protein